MIIKEFIGNTFRYNLDESLDDKREYYRFDPTSQGSVPQALIAFLESNDYEDAIRKAISIGGDSDTIACIAGGAAQAFYRVVPNEIENKALELLDERLREIIRRFVIKYI